jgi:threonine dehydrogenase-like Zn-dependent dehydrogenase
MQAAIVTAPRQCRVEDVAPPEPAHDQVRLRVEGCGICGSNLAPWEGRPWFKYPFAPGELGHEGWGIVEAVGPDVKSVREGDRVAMLSYRSYAEYDVAPENSVIRLPPELKAQPFPGEALGCAMNVFRRCDIRAGDSVAIVGIGFLGAVLTTLCAKAGARVTAVSRRDFALEIAKKVGAHAALKLQTPGSNLQRSTKNQAPNLNGAQTQASAADFGCEEIIQLVRESTGGKGCDRVIEAAGVQSALDLATELTRERGRLIIAGYHQDGMRQVNMQLWNWRGLDVINAHEREPQVYRDGVELAVQKVASGELDPSPLYTHRFRLTELGLGLDAMRHRADGFLKGLVFASQRR